jgi:hypothetical protein
MQTVFSHIIRKRLSPEYENVATDALSYILNSSEGARRGVTALLRGILPDLPTLSFRTQQTDGAIRVDMCGFDDSDVRVFIENKFWAGLTDSQPVLYLRKLAACPQPTLLLVIAPARRQEAIWRDLTQRISEQGISVSIRENASGIHRSLSTDFGPILALTSWSNVFSAIEHEVGDDASARGDLTQLRALCDAADIDAFSPFAASELTNQRTPALIIQLANVVQDVIQRSVTERVIDTTKLMPMHSWDRIGRYAKLSCRLNPGIWLGVRFDLWKSHGGSPLWLTFTYGEFGKAGEVRALIELWAAKNGRLTSVDEDELAIALHVPVAQEKETIVTALVHDLKEIATVLDIEPKRREKAAPSNPRLSPS